MTAKSQKVTYIIATGLLTAIILMFIANSIFNNEQFMMRFARLGYPTYLVYPLVVVKILALVAIWSNLSNRIKEWAYAGFLFVFILAFLAEMHATDGELISSVLAFFSLCASYFFWNRLQHVENV